MSEVPKSESPKFSEGFVFPPWECAVTQAEQERKLRYCGLDPAVFGDRLDMTQLAYLAILAVRRSGISINGRVHMSQYFDLRDPLILGEKLSVEGSVVSVTPDRRGVIEESQFDFVRGDGSVPLTTRRRSLVLDPTVGAERTAKANGPRTRRNPTADMTHLAQYRLVPEQVAAYSADAENLIHSDPETARRFGFRAPIAAGLMAVHFMMAALYDPLPPDRLRMTVRFRRPMFWDDTLDLWRQATDGPDAPPVALAVVNGDGKVVNDCAIDHIAYPS
ncbi:MAG: MaoC/PaaZ C-terminal domain-containing protein [Pseudomonadota bacterium]